MCSDAGSTIPDSLTAGDTDSALIWLASALAVTPGARGAVGWKPVARLKDTPFFIHPSPISADRVRQPVVLTTARDWQSVLAHAAVDRLQVDVEWLVLGACIDRLHIRCQHGPWQLLGGQRTQIAVLLVLQKRARFQHRNLAITHIQQATHTHSGFGRPAQSREHTVIVCSFPRHDLRRQRQAQGIQRREHHVSVVADRGGSHNSFQLEQPLLRHRPLPAGRRAIDSHPFGLQVAHLHDPLVHGRFEVLPLLVIVSGIQHNVQTVIALFPVANSLSAAPLQRLPPSGCP
jgi:hypothetical protein